MVSKTNNFSGWGKGSYGQGEEEFEILLDDEEKYQFIEVKYNIIELYASFFKEMSS